MTLQIDGYTPPAKEVALEQGVTFTYPTAYGEIIIRSKLAGRDNAPFRLAMQNFDQWFNRRKNLTKNAVDNEADERMIGLVHDHLVISWSTTIKSGGQAIEATRKNFIDLLMSPACKGVLTLYLEDSADEEHFRPLTSEELEGNSQAPSDGTSNGVTKKTG